MVATQAARAVLANPNSPPATFAKAKAKAPTAAQTIEQAQDNLDPASDRPAPKRPAPKAKQSRGPSPKQDSKNLRKASMW
jgi:hypothetical protein